MGKLTGPSMAELLLKQYAGLKDDEHGEDTPSRWVSTLDEMTACRDSDNDHMKSCVKWKMFPTNSNEMIIVRDITFVSLCNHHVLPFVGTAHIGYVPQHYHAGLSKFARVVRHYARQLQIQERLTLNIADYLYNALEPRGLAVVMSAEHMCMTLRGVQAPGTLTTTSDMRGVFIDHRKTAKQEFMEFIGAKR